MKKLLLLPILALLSLPSCQTVQSARDKLAQMPEADYQQLAIAVEDAAHLGGLSLKNALAERADAALEVTREIKALVEAGQINAVDLIQHVVEQYSARLGLTAEQLEYVRSGAQLIDAAVGQIRLDIDGKLTVREKGLLLALLGGLERGLE